MRVLPVAAEILYDAAMRLFPTCARRAPLLALVLLSACAATGSRSLAAATAGGGGGSTASAVSLDRFTSEGALLAARIAASRDQQRLAVKFYEKALAARTGRPNGERALILNHAFASALLADTPQQVAFARDLPDNGLADLVLGNHALMTGDDAAAQRFYARLPSRSGVGMIRPLLIAWTQAGQGDTDAAIDRLKGRFDNAGFGPVYALNAALIADRAGRAAQAAPLYRLARQSYGAVNLRLAQILASWDARRGETAKAADVLARMAHEHPDLALALPALEREAAKPAVSTVRDGAAEAYLTLAGSLSSKGEASLRDVLLRFALRLRPDLGAARLLLADTQAERGATAKAARTLAQVGRNDPLYAPALLRRAALLDSEGKGEALLPELADLAQAHPQSTAPLLQAAEIQRNAGHYAKARMLYSRAIGLLGANPPLSAWPLFYGRAIAEDKLGDWSAAEADLHRALALAPDQPFILNYLGYSYALRGVHLQRAQQMIEQALQVDPNDGAIIDSLGYVLYRRGKTQQALQTEIRAVENAPDDPEVNAHLARMFEAAGDHLAARYQYARTLGLNPAPKLRAKIEAALKAARKPSGQPQS